MRAVSLSFLQLSAKSYLPYAFVLLLSLDSLIPAGAARNFSYAVFNPSSVMCLKQTYLRNSLHS
jgi:hypothetical protein